jgi:hypothetical protein
VPHFEAETLDGRRVRYADIWQRRNLVVVAAGDRQESDAPAWLTDLREGIEPFKSDTELVVTSRPMAGLEHLTALVADQWGQVVYVTDGAPDVDELLSWVQFIRIQCPECPP